MASILYTAMRNQVFQLWLVKWASWSPDCHLRAESGPKATRLRAPRISNLQEHQEKGLIIVSCYKDLNYVVA